MIHLKVMMGTLFSNYLHVYQELHILGTQGTHDAPNMYSCHVV